ncbi:MAG: hypothetical protein HQ515_17310 [Phycisphaeraceae bacterium]|nr:hypothetical protein [Phycisphaeraceae bacterium]
MVDIFTRFELSAQAYHIMVLMVPGLAGALVGIFLWLGGSLYARTSVAIVWLLLVIGVGFFFMKPLVSVGVGVMVSIVAMVVNRLSTGVILSVLMTFIVFLVVCQYADFAETARGSRPGAGASPNAVSPINEGVRLAVPETFEHLKLMISGVARSCFQVGQAMEIKYQVVVGVTAFFALLMGCVLQRLAKAVCCATAGVLLMWGGMVLMLLAKGAMPLTGLYARAGMCAAVIPAMIGVGALEQLLFCSRPASQDRDSKAASGKKGK